MGVAHRARGVLLRRTAKVSCGRGLRYTGNDARAMLAGARSAALPMAGTGLAVSLQLHSHASLTPTAKTCDTSSVGGHVGLHGTVGGHVGLSGAAWPVLPETRLDDWHRVASASVLHDPRPGVTGLRVPGPGPIGANKHGGQEAADSGVPSCSGQASA